MLTADFDATVEVTVTVNREAKELLIVPSLESPDHCGLQRDEEGQERSTRRGFHRATSTSAVEVVRRNYALRDTAFRDECLDQAQTLREGGMVDHRWTPRQTAQSGMLLRHANVNLHVRWPLGCCQSRPELTEPT